MNVILYSSNEDVLVRWKEIVSAQYSSVETHNNSTDVDNLLTIRAEKSILLYQLSGVEGEDQWLKNFQQRHQQYLFIIALSNNPDPRKGLHLLDIGVRGFANTFSSAEKLLMAIDVVNKGEVWLGDALIKYILAYLKSEFSAAELDQQNDNSSANNIFKKLTPREQQIAQKVLLGKQNKIIADELNITERTVKTHLSAIYKKAEVRNRLELSLALQKIDRRSNKKRVDRRRFV